MLLRLKSVNNEVEAAAVMNLVPPIKAIEVVKTNLMAKTEYIRIELIEILH